MATFVENVAAIKLWHKGLLPSLASWVKKIGRAGSCNFLTDNCKFLMQEIMGAWNSIFARKFSPKMWFFNPKFCIFERKNFLTRRKFCDNFPSTRNLGCAIASHTPPPCHNATVYHILYHGLLPAYCVQKNECLDKLQICSLVLSAPHIVWL